MNGIDISSHDTGINTATIPGEFVIVKATQGTKYVNPDFERSINQAMCSKLLGIYHYIGGQGPIAEMDHFITHFQGYQGHAIACLDWEKIQNSAWGNENYLRECIEYFIKQTGIRPFIYASLSSFPHALCETYGCPKWIAQYANDRETGYQDHPWNEGAYTCTIRQYTSNGRLEGWSDRLDLDKAYISADEWKAYARGSNVPVKPQPKPEPAYTIAVDGIWGPDTTTALQRALGTTVDGIVSNQSAVDFDRVNRGGLKTTTWKFGKGGSQVIRALQRKVGSTVDGYFGPKTCKTLQNHLGTVIDGKVSKPSQMVEEMQRRLNTGSF